jgi:hypothetical protein
VSASGSNVLGQSVVFKLVESIRITSRETEDHQWVMRKGGKDNEDTAVRKSELVNSGNMN